MTHRLAVARDAFAIVGVYREAMAAAGASRGGRAFADPDELEGPTG